MSAPEEIRELLINQVVTAVQWEKSIRVISDAGVSHFVEIGPGRPPNIRREGNVEARMTGCLQDHPNDDVRDIGSG